MINPVLRDRVRELKENPGGRKTMCAIVDKLCEERANERTTENVMGLIADGSIPYEKIAKALKLPLSEVQRIAEEMKKQPKVE